MKRQVIAILLLLALVLQGPVVAFASPSAAAAAQACPMGISDSSAKSCCTHHAHVMSCCLDECASVIAVPLATAYLTRQSFSQPVLASDKAALASREDAPLIRPPIS